MKNIFPSSMICFNGSRLSCQKNGDRKGQALGATLFICACFTVVFIIHMEQQHQVKTVEIRTRYMTRDAALNSIHEATDLTDDSLSYAIVLDCGSSGTRLYLYYWPPHSGNHKELLDIHQVIGLNSKPMSKKITPGLSTYNDKPEISAEYLKELLRYAAETIPTYKHKQTPLYILATAGMRLIPSQDAEAIVDDITKDIPEWFDFHFEPSHVEILTGKAEGMYAWISLNYMLGRFSHSTSSGDLIDTQPSVQANSEHMRKPTVGVIDVGGGSLQIAFEVPNAETVKVEDHGLTTTFNLGCEDGDTDHTYSLYVTTFLGYGANSALNRYRQQLISNYTENAVVPDDCLPRNMEDIFRVDGTGYKLKGSGNVTACINNVKPLLDKSVECKTYPCSINGVHQPPISNTWKFYGISELWYSVYDVLNLPGLYNFAKVKQQAEIYCDTEWKTTMERYKKKLYPNADDNRMKNECFKVSWMMTILHDGLEFPENFTGLTSANQINGQEVQWTLGALIHKTRYFPSLRVTSGGTNKPWLGHKGAALVPYILVLCIGIVIGAICLYCRHLQKMKLVPSLKSVPSMSYFMTDSDQMEQGLIKEGQYFIET